jgi:hypothetical protein
MLDITAQFSSSSSAEVHMSESAPEGFLRQVNDFQSTFLHVKNDEVKRKVYLPLLLCRFRAALKV